MAASTGKNANGSHKLHVAVELLKRASDEVDLLGTKGVDAGLLEERRTAAKKALSQDRFDEAASIAEEIIVLAKAMDEMAAMSAGLQEEETAERAEVEEIVKAEVAARMEELMVDLPTRKELQGFIADRAEAVGKSIVSSTELKKFVTDIALSLVRSAMGRSQFVSKDVARAIATEEAQKVPVYADEDAARVAKIEGKRAATSLLKDKSLSMMMKATAAAEAKRAADAVPRFTSEEAKEIAAEEAAKAGDAVARLIADTARRIAAEEAAKAAGAVPRFTGAEAKKIAADEAKRLLDAAAPVTEDTVREIARIEGKRASSNLLKDNSLKMILLATAAAEAKKAADAVPRFTADGARKIATEEAKKAADGVPRFTSEQARQIAVEEAKKAAGAVPRFTADGARKIAVEEAKKAAGAVPRFTAEQARQIAIEEAKKAAGAVPRFTADGARKIAVEEAKKAADGVPRFTPEQARQIAADEGKKARQMAVQEAGRLIVKQEEEVFAKVLESPEMARVIVSLAEIESAKAVEKVPHLSEPEVKRIALEISGAASESLATKEALVGLQESLAGEPERVVKKAVAEAKREMEEKAGSLAKAEAERVMAEIRAEQSGVKEEIARSVMAKMAPAVGALVAAEGFGSRLSRLVSSKVKDALATMPKLKSAGIEPEQLESLVRSEVERMAPQGPSADEVEAMRTDLAGLKDNIAAVEETAAKAAVTSTEELEGLVRREVEQSAGKSVAAEELESLREEVAQIRESASAAEETAKKAAAGISLEELEPLVRSQIEKAAGEISGTTEVEPLRNELAELKKSVAAVEEVANKASTGMSKRKLQSLVRGQIEKIAGTISAAEEIEPLRKELAELKKDVATAGEIGGAKEIEPLRKELEEVRKTVAAAEEAAKKAPPEMDPEKLKDLVRGEVEQAVGEGKPGAKFDVEKLKQTVKDVVRASIESFMKGDVLKSRIGEVVSERVGEVPSGPSLEDVALMLEDKLSSKLAEIPSGLSADEVGQMLEETLSAKLAEVPTGISAEEVDKKIGEVVGGDVAAKIDPKIIEQKVKEAAPLVIKEIATSDEFKGLLDAKFKVIMKYLTDEIVPKTVGRILSQGR